jgi:hypothetical protein
MARELAFAASLKTPPWAEASDPDEEAVIHSRRVAALVDLDGGEFAVDLVQRDDLCLTGGGVALVREPAWARVAGVRIGLDQAACLAGMLMLAKEMAEGASPTGQREVAEPVGGIVEPSPLRKAAPGREVPGRAVYRQMAESERSRSIVRRWVAGAAKVGRSR